jgi:hypothetical protein
VSARTLLAVVWLSLPALPAGQVALDCTADAWVAIQTSSLSQVTGAGPELVLDGSRKVILLDFNTAAIRGWKLQSALLLVHLRSGRAPTRVNVAIHTDDWDEQAVTSKLAPPKRALPSEAFFAKDGWLEVKLPPQFVEALAAGRGRGLIVAGYGRAPGCVFDSRESKRFAPYLLVEGRP